MVLGAAGGGDAGGDGHLQHGLAGPDGVAVVQVGALDPMAVDVGAVAAAHVHQTAMRRVDFHEEMDAREIAVLARQTEVGALRSADEEGIVAVEGEDLALVRPLGDGQRNAHGSGFRRATVPRQIMPFVGPAQVGTPAASL